MLFPIPPGAPVAPCRSCAAPVVWIVTSAGKRMPVDAAGDTRGQSHFSTCAQANDWRKPKERNASAR